MEKKGYAEKRAVLQALGLRGDEKRNGSGSGDTRTAYEIVEALKRCSVDAVRVTRCGECHWCLRYHALRMPRCICPEMPPHFVREDGYCNYGKPKGGGGNG